MCGIHFLWDKQQRGVEGVMKAMVQSTHYRGADATGTYQWEHYHLGHNRLKIIDLDNTANQPWVSADGRWVMVYNGEIYNYQSLKSVLARHYHFQTQSDTEVLGYFLAEKITAQYRLYPPKAQYHKAASGSWSLIQLPDLDGMYAFVLLDTHTRQVYVGRDPQGIKPLYYYESHEYLIFCSELRGLRASGLVPWRIAAASVEHYLRYRYACPPSTLIESVWEVDSHPAFIVPSRSSLPLPTDIEALIRSVVQAQLVSDVGTGILLSGGVDSTLLLSLWNSLGYKHIPAFTLTHADTEASFGTLDSHFARQAARQYDADIHEVFLGAQDLRDLPEAAAQADTAIGDIAYWLTAHLSQSAARQGIKVLLSGAGADEWWGGYNRHRAFAQYLRLPTWGRWGLSCVGKATKWLPDGSAYRGRKQIRLWKKLLANIHSQPAHTWAQFTALQHQSGREMLTHRPIVHNLNEALYDDRYYYLWADVLRLTDNASMRYGVEVRVPYLSIRLTEVLQHVEATTLLKHGQKHILKRVLETQQGHSYTQRVKEGFGIPLGEWLRQAQGAALLADISARSSPLYYFLEKAVVQRCIALHSGGYADYTSEIAAWLMLHYWLEKNC